MLNNWRQDVQYGLRMLRKNPGFAFIAVLTLALGIGANTALFSVVNGVLLNPLPYEQPNRLVALYTKTAEFNHSSISYPNFLDWRRNNQTFTAVAAFRPDDYNLTGMGDAERLRAEMISATFFPILGVKPSAGRVFTEQEDQLGAAPVVMISEGLWKRKFGGAPDVIGKNLTLNAIGYTIVGVVPASFHYQSGNFHNNAEVYTLIGQWGDKIFQDRRVGMGMDAVGRLKPGVTVEQARADMSNVAQQLAKIYPDSNKDSGVTVTPLKEDVTGDIRPFLVVLLAAVGFVLLIACVNVANLLLARSTGRTREFAIRSALGASSSRVVGQVLTESVLLAVAGGALGLMIASWGTQAAIKVLPGALPRADEISLDGRVLVFTLVASLLAGLLFGLVPAFKTSRTDVHETLKEGGRSGGGMRHRTQSLFVIVEMAMALVLLVGAGLMIRSLSKLWTVNPGFDPNNVLSFSLASSQPFGNTPEEMRAAFRRVHDAVGNVPGVQAVSLSVGSTPMSGDSELPFWLEGEPKPASQSEMKNSLFYFVEPEYLNIMRIPLLRGRFLTASDREKSAPVVVIDEQFAKLYFGDKDPIGRHVNYSILNMSPEIVGIVGHVKQWGLQSDATSPIQAQSYLSVTQVPDEVMPLLAHGLQAMARTEHGPKAQMQAIGHAVAAVNSDIVVYGGESMTDVIADSLAAQRFAMVLLGVFAGLAVILSSVGIYGVISYIAGQRTHEIGIRMALGAERGNVLQMVLQEAGRMALIGVGIGLVVALALTRLMSSLLYGVKTYDPVTFGGVAILLMLVALAACYVPARRATKVDPMVALRYE